MQSIRLSALTLLASGLTASISHAQDWTRFRGPDGSGVAVAESIPVRITEKDYLWNVKLPGSGKSSPVVYGDKVFLTCSDPAAEGTRMIACLSAKDGSLLWKTPESFNKYHMHRFNSFASPTPAVDAGCVYMAALSGEELFAFALDHSGKELWKEKIGYFKAEHGYGNSPVLIDGVLVIMADHMSKTDAGIYGLNPKTGKRLWKFERSSEKSTYSTPSVYRPKDGGPAQLIISSFTFGMTGLDPKSGKMLWNLPAKLNGRAVGSSAITDGIIFSTGGAGGAGKGAIALTPGDGKDKKPAELWTTTKRIPYVPTPVGYKGHFFLWKDAGMVSCIEAKSGKVLWDERVTDPGYVSPICVNGKLYGISQNGELAVLDAGPEFKILHRHKLPESTDASPAVAGGKMFIRTENRLICVGKK